MVDPKGLVIDTPSYQELVSAIKQMQNKAVTGHVVVWETDERNHDSTKYVVKEYGKHLGEPTLVLWGRGGDKKNGGKYEIIPKPNSPAWIRYHYPDGRVRDEELTKLAVFSPDFAYAKKEGWHVFLEQPFEILSRLKP